MKRTCPWLLMRLLLTHISIVECFIHFFQPRRVYNKPSVYGPTKLRIYFFTKPCILFTNTTQILAPACGLQLSGFPTKELPCAKLVHFAIILDFPIIRHFTPTCNSEFDGWNWGHVDTINLFLPKSVPTTYIMSNNLQFGNWIPRFSYRIRLERCQSTLACVLCSGIWMGRHLSSVL